MRLCVSAFDRAAPHGTGHIKAGLNYAMSLHAYMAAHAAGYDENMFLDAATRTYVEETGGANFLFVTKNGTVVTPKSGSILPSITRRSLVYIAEHILGMKVEERPVAFAELSEVAECGLGGRSKHPKAGSAGSADDISSFFERRIPLYAENSHGRTKFFLENGIGHKDF